MWDKGEYMGYTYCVKHYDEPSAEYGINGGRISKLEIRKDGNVMYAYERGLYVDTTDKGTHDVLDYLMAIYG